jgi:hypothetical protein
MFTHQSYGADGHTLKTTDRPGNGDFADFGPIRHCENRLLYFLLPDLRKQAFLERLTMSKYGF